METIKLENEFYDFVQWQPLNIAHKLEFSCKGLSHCEHKALFVHVIVINIKH